jgi:hypothetical protein
MKLCGSLVRKQRAGRRVVTYLRVRMAIRGVRRTSIAR